MAKVIYKVVIHWSQILANIVLIVGQLRHKGQ